jgi:hypothetical protein
LKNGIDIETASAALKHRHQQNDVVRLIITQTDQDVEVLSNVQPYTQAATSSEATCLWHGGTTRSERVIRGWE